MPCSQSAFTARAAKAANSTNSTRRERQLGTFTASTGLLEKATPFDAATRAEVRRSTRSFGRFISRLPSGIAYGPG